MRFVWNGVFDAVVNYTFNLHLHVLSATMSAFQFNKDHLVDDYSAQMFAHFLLC